MLVFGSGDALSGDLSYKSYAAIEVVTICVVMANVCFFQDPVVKHSVHTLVFRSLKRTHDMFLAHEGQPIPEDDLA